MQKALREIGFDQYYQAEQVGWVLYLEGSTDLAILQAFADRLGNKKAIQALERPFVHYVANQPRAAAHHYYGLREALPNLQGIALFDRLDPEPADIGPLQNMIWTRREIENYVCTRTTLEAYATATAVAAQPMPLFTDEEVTRRLGAMREAIAEIEKAMKTLSKGSPWEAGVKASDDFLVPLFKTYFDRINLPNLMEKKQFYELAQHVPADQIAPEITEKLDAIASVAESAKPAS